MQIFPDAHNIFAMLQQFLYNGGKYSAATIHADFTAARREESCVFATTYQLS